MTTKIDLKAYIESYGTYLPPKIISAKEIQQGLKIEGIDLSKATGIERKRKAKNMSSFDLSYEASRKCLERSEYNNHEIDLVICTSISKGDATGKSTNEEPSESFLIKKKLNLINAFCFDINNACAGMYTAVSIAEKLIKSGLIKRVLICSGEHISPISETAMRFIDKKHHPDMAALTLGDAGAALILDATNEDKGIKSINMLTSGFGSEYCRSYHPDDEIGGYGMKTDSKKMISTGVEIFPEIFQLSLLNSKKQPENLFYIMHQISMAAFDMFRNSIVNHLKNDNIPTFYKNVKELGNTASTTHTLALAKAIRDEKIKDNDDIAFLIQASGITIGAAIVGIGDLPSRMKTKKQTLQLRAKKASKTDEDLIIYLRKPMLELKRLSVLENREEAVNDHIARTCRLLDFDSKNISTFIHTSQYRQEFSEEPSQAAIIMDKLDIMGNAENLSFGFDIIRGASSFLPSILSASAIGQEIEKDIIISSGEYLGSGTQDLNLSNASTACLLSQSTGKGFSAISFHDYPHLENKLKSRFYTPKPAHLAVSICPKYEQYLIACIEDALDRRRKVDLKDISDFDYYILPQKSKSFIERLARKLKLDLAKCIISSEDKDHYSSSVPMAINKLPKDKKDAKALIIEAGSGICVNIGIYDF